MPISFLKTDGGPHSAKDWAVTSAAHIIEIATHADPSKVAEARKFEGALIDLLEKAHGDLQKAGRAHHKKHGSDVAMHPKQHIDPAVKAILVASKHTPFEAHFHKPETIEYIKQVLGKHFATSLNIEAQWAKIRN